MTYSHKSHRITSLKTQAGPDLRRENINLPLKVNHGKVILKDEQIGWFQLALNNVICQKHHVPVHVKEWNCIQIAAGGDQLLTTMMPTL